MDTLRPVMIGALVGAPLLACGLSLLESRLSRRVLLTIAQLAAASVLLSMIGLRFIPSVRPDAVGEFWLETFEELGLVTWLRVPGFGVALGVRWDVITLLQMWLTTVVLIGVLSVWPKQVSLQWLMLAWFGVTLANVAGNLGQLFVAWILSAWASSELARPCDTGPDEASAFRPVWLVQRVCDIATLGGVGLIWMHFGSSLSFSAWTPEAIGALRPELMESIALCVLIGVIGRCAQLPLTVWLETKMGFAAQRGHSMARLSDELVGVWNVPDGHAVAERLKADPTNRWHDSSDGEIPSPVLAWWLCGAFLPMGVGLIARCEPLFVVASHARLLMVAVGAFTLAMCSANAAAQNNWSRVLGQVAVAQCGLTLVAFGFEEPQAHQLAIRMFLCQSLVLAVLFIADAIQLESPLMTNKPILVGLAVLCLASGLLGRQAVLNRIIEQAWPTQSVASTEAESLVFGSTESRVWFLVIGLACVSELLTSFSLLRAFFLEAKRVSGRIASSSKALARAFWIPIGAVCMGLLAIPLADHDSNVPEFRTPSVFAVGNLMLLSAVGAVLAWWLYSKPSSLPEKLSIAMGPFARLSRNCFYWGDLYFLLIVYPATTLAKWLVAVDTEVFGSAFRALRSRVLTSWGESAEPLAKGAPAIGALTTWGSAIVLAWLLMWLR